jgi:hypothetical protein
MREKATIIAIVGIILITLSLIILSGVTGQPLDYETIKMVVSGLVGFAGGIGGTIAVTALTANKVE